MINENDINGDQDDIGDDWGSALNEQAEASESERVQMSELTDDNTDQVNEENRCIRVFISLFINAGRRCYPN